MKHISQLGWRDIQLRLPTKYSKHLAKIALNLGDDAIAYECSYGYGDPISQKGVLQYSLPRSQLFLEHQAQKDLSYAPLPFGVLLEGSAELSFSKILAVNRDRVYRRFRREFHIPVRCIDQGQSFGDIYPVSSPEVLKNDNFLLTMAAGSISIYPVLPNAETKGGRKFYERVFKKEYFTREMIHDFYQNHSKFIRESSFGKDWECKILFFPKQWVTPQSIAGFPGMYGEVCTKLAYKDLDNQTELMVMNSLNDNHNQDHIYYLGALINKLNVIFEGRAPVMKPVIPNDNGDLISSYLCFLREQFREVTKARDTLPLLFRYGYLKNGEWGLFPTTIPQLRIPGFDEFFNSNRVSKDRQDQIKSAIYGLNGTMNSLPGLGNPNHKIIFHSDKLDISNRITSDLKINSGHEDLFDGHLLLEKLDNVNSR